MIIWIINLMLEPSDHSSFWDLSLEIDQLFDSKVKSQASPDTLKTEISDFSLLLKSGKVTKDNKIDQIMKSHTKKIKYAQKEKE